MRAWLLWPVIACLLIAAPVTAAKGPRARPIDVSISPDGTPYHTSDSQVGAFLVSDGRRYFAFKRTTTTLRVYDGSSKRLFDYEIGPRCTPMDISWRRVLLSCQDPNDASGTVILGPRLLDIRARTLRAYEFPPRYEGDHYYRLGRYWLQAWHRADRASWQTYLNWRTGQGRDPGSEDKAARDIDSPDLARLPRTWREELRIYGRSRGYELTDGRRDPVTGNSSLVLLGRRGRIVLCRSLCYEPDLASGIATWIENSRAYAYLIGDRKRFRLPRTIGPAALVHTKHELVVAVRRTNGSNEPDRYRIYAARIGH